MALAGCDFGSRSGTLPCGSCCFDVAAAAALVVIPSASCVAAMVASSLVAVSVPVAVATRKRSKNNLTSPASALKPMASCRHRALSAHSSVFDNWIAAAHARMPRPEGASPRLTIPLSTRMGSSRHTHTPPWDVSVVSWPESGSGFLVPCLLALDVGSWVGGRGCRE